MNHRFKHLFKFWKINYALEIHILDRLNLSSRNKLIAKKILRNHKRLFHNRAHRFIEML